MLADQDGTQLTIDPPYYQKYQHLMRHTLCGPLKGPSIEVCCTPCYAPVIAVAVWWLAPRQSSASHLLNTFIPSTTVSAEFFEPLVASHALGHHGFHGRDHWLRVVLNGRLLAAGTGANLRVVELFVLVRNRTHHNTSWWYHLQLAISPRDN